MTWPSLSVQVAFISNPYAPIPTFTEIGSKAKRIRIITGRTKELDPFPPGVAAVDLDNADRLFDPENAAGTYYTALKANKQFKIEATYLLTTYPMYGGWTDGWVQHYDPPASATAELTAADSLKRLAKSKPSWDIYADEVRTDVPRAWWRFGETTGSSYSDYSGNGFTLNADDLLGVSSSTADSLIQAENGAVKLPVLGSFRAPGANPTAGSTLSVEFWIHAQATPLRSYALGAYETPPDLIAAAGFTVVILSYDIPGSGIYGGVYFRWPGATAWGFKSSAVSVFDNQIHHVVITHNGNTNLIYVDGVNRTDEATNHNAVGALTNIAGQVVVNESYPGTDLMWQDGPVLDEVALYPQVLTADRVLAHYRAGTAPWDGDTTGQRVTHILDRAGFPSSVGWRSIDTGLEKLGPAVWSADSTALALLDQVEISELGYLTGGRGVTFKERTSRLSSTRSIVSQATISDNPATSDLRYSALVGTYDEAIIINSVTVKWIGGTAVATDSASINSNGEQGMSIDTALPSLVAAQYFADGLLRRYKDPIGRFESILLNPAADDSLFPEILARQIGDRITVRRHPQGVGAAITFDCIVEGIEHEINEGVNVWLTTYHLSRADPGSYWILDTSALESTAILAF